MNKYELCLVLSARLEDEQRADALERVKGYVTRLGGEIADIDEWGQRKLAYPIQKMDEGFYYFIHFDAEAAAPAEIEAQLRIMEPVLRFLIVKQEA